MTMGSRYVVLGSGRQGTYAAYDLARYVGVESLVLADIDLKTAQSSAKRVNTLMGDNVAKAVRVDVTNKNTVLRFIKDSDVFLSAVPYSYNLGLSRLAVKAKASMVDLGGHTEIVMKQLALDRTAKKAGITIVPDCGMGPGANVTLAVHAMRQLDEVEEVRIYDGGLPLNPRPPWNYSLLFHIGGLSNEYTGTATFLRNGKRVVVPALSEPEDIVVEDLGKLEARVTTGGLSTMPWTFEGKLRVLENKTLRYPGHWARMEAFADLGLFSEKPVKVGRQNVVPSDVFNALFGPQVYDPDVRDVAVIRVVAKGTKDGQQSTVAIELIDRFDEKTKFRAMERLTGGHSAIVMAMIAYGEIPPGAQTVEKAVNSEKFISEALKRGIEITVKETGG